MNFKIIRVRRIDNLNFNIVFKRWELCECSATRESTYIRTEFGYEPSLDDIIERVEEELINKHNYEKVHYRG